MTESIERVATNLRRGVLEYCVLALLSREERYGLDLATELIERSLIAGEGSLYPLLSRMRESGSVETRVHAAGGGGRPRKRTETNDRHPALRSGGQNPAYNRHKRKGRR